MTEKNKIQKDIKLFANQIANNFSDFNDSKGPDVGNRWSQQYAKSLREKIEQNYSDKEIFPEHQINKDLGYKFDYYIPSEETVIEIALSLHNSNTEFEKDILKVLLALESNQAIRKLLFIGKKGCEKRMDQPGNQAIIQYLRNKHCIDIEIFELSG